MKDLSNERHQTLQLLGRDSGPKYRLYYNEEEIQVQGGPEDETPVTMYTADFVPDSGGVAAVNGSAPSWSVFDAMLAERGVADRADIKVRYDAYVADHKDSFLLPDLPFTGDCEEWYDTTTPDGAKAYMLEKIEAYDLSYNVNSFSLNGMRVWLDKSTRVGLMNSITIEKNAGKTESVLWLDGLSLTVGCDAAIAMLSQLELYALACYNRTAEHKAAVSALGTVGDILAYDYTTGYPEKLVFNLNS